MQISPIDSRWEGMIDPRSIARLDATPFLRRCRDGTVTRAELDCFVVQQQHYSRHFTRYLCALISNLHDDADRLELTENLFEEMGLGEMGDIPHARLYLEMMERMGLAADDEAPNPETRALSERMFSACANPDAIVGLAALCLGAEAIVPHLYSQVVTGFEAHGESAENLHFYRLHIEGDDEHAVTLKRVIERELERDPSKLGRMRETASALIEARARFFEAIQPRAHQTQPYEEAIHAIG